MNHREPPQLPAGVRRALRCLSLLLVPAIGLDQGHAGTRLPGSSGHPLPYLPVLGSLALRFAEEPPPPDLVTRPPAAAPPVPALTPTESSVAAANSDAARSTGSVPKPAADSAPAEPSSAGNADAGAAKAPAAILPDSTHPVVRPEDFLPYFQIPGSAKQPGDISILTPGVSSAPSPAPIPPSSATYTQTPR